MATRRTRSQSVEAATAAAAASPAADAQTADAHSGTTAAAVASAAITTRGRKRAAPREPSADATLPAAANAQVRRTVASTRVQAAPNNAAEDIEADAAAPQCSSACASDVSISAPSPQFASPSAPDAIAFSVWHTLRQSEQYYQPVPCFLRWHGELNSTTRHILLGWMQEVAQEYLLHRETYFLAVNFTDRYLSSVRDVPRLEVQLVALASLQLASKIEEIHPPSIHDFALTSDGAFTADNMRDMEAQMIRALDWCLAPVTCFQWFSLLAHHLCGCCPESDMAKCSESKSSCLFNGRPSNRGLSAGYVMISRFLDVPMASLLLDAASMQMWSLSVMPSVLASAVLLATVRDEHESRAVDIIDTLVLNGHTGAHTWRSCCDIVGQMLAVLPDPPLHPNLNNLQRKHVAWDVLCHQTRCSSLSAIAEDMKHVKIVAAPREAVGTAADGLALIADQRRHRTAEAMRAPAPAPGPAPGPAPTLTHVEPSHPAVVLTADDELEASSSTPVSEEADSDFLMANETLD